MDVPQPLQTAHHRLVGQCQRGRHRQKSNRLPNPSGVGILRSDSSCSDFGKSWKQVLKEFAADKNAYVFRVLGCDEKALRILSGNKVRIFEIPSIW